MLKLSLAPMEGLTTFPSRLWLYMASAPKLMTTPFLRVTKHFPRASVPDQFMPELTVLKGSFDYEIVPQFITGEPDNFLRASETVFPHLTNQVEINCGCPCPTSSGKLAGSGILAEPDLFVRTITKLSDRLGAKHLTVKMRTGIVSHSEFERLLQGIKDLPLGRLTIHGRTRKAMYKGQADWDVIHRAARTTKIPVVGSGDVVCADSLRDRLGECSALDSVMIGRGAMMNPWIFSDILLGKRFVPPLVLANSLLTYALIHELWQTNEKKLFARIQSGRLGSFCGYDIDLWEKSARILMQTLGGYPSGIVNADNLPMLPVGGNSLARLKVLWGYMRTGLPKEFMRPAIMKAKNADMFFSEFFIAQRLHDENLFAHPVVGDD